MTNVNSVDHGNRIGGPLLLVAACGICNGGLALSRLGVKLVNSLATAVPPWCTTQL